MERGTVQLLPAHGDTYELSDALDQLFASILSHLAETDVFGQSGSPSVFVVYAHDNEKEGVSNSWCVRLLIEWLGAIRSRTVSDKAPLPLWASRAGGSGSIRNILSNQFCLLPASEAPSDVGVIHRVDKVVVCGSEVLKRYYEHTFTASYIDAIVTSYFQGQENSADSRALENGIRNIVETQCQHDAFHHVLTELAFLKLRSSQSKDNHGIIPITLNGDLMSWLPFRDNCDLVFKAKSLKKTDLHQLFFNVLAQIYVGEHTLINKCKACYDQARKRFTDEPVLSETRCQQIIDQEVSKTQKLLRGLESAAFRSQRQDRDRATSNQLHHSTDQKLQYMRTNLEQLIGETWAIRTKLEGDKFREIIDWLSTCSFRLHHKSVSSSLMLGSGRWVTSHSAYLEWCSSVASSIMLVHGVRGSGKSSMFSVIVDQLLSDHDKNRDRPVCAYFYCADTPSEPDRASPVAILRSILRQLAIDDEKSAIEPRVLSEYNTLADSLKSRTNVARLGKYECLKLIMELTADRTTYIALDAIDELREGGRAELIEALQRVVNESRGLVRVLVTSRNDAQIEGLLQSAIALRVSPSENGCDIENFIEAQLNAVVRSRRLLNGYASNSLLERIRKSLITGAQEMFLWVQLQIEALCRKKTENDIATALDAGLAANLDEMYNKTYQQFLALDETAKLVVQGVFSWILYGKSPLTVDALRHALLLSPALANRSSEVILPDLFDVCHNLVVLDSAMDTLRLCHPSARDYMRRRELFSEVIGNRLLAATCLQQCSQGLDSRLDQSLSIVPLKSFHLYAGLYWPEHLQMAEVPVSDTDSTFQLLARFVFIEDDSFLDMAFIEWLEWVKRASKELPPYHALRKTHECLTSPGDPSPLLTACVFGLSCLLHLTLSRMDEVDLEQRSDTGHTPLYLACTFGHSSVVPKLIECGANVNVACGSYGNPLQAACFRGHVEIVKTLLENGVSPRGSAVFTNALHAACEGSRANIADFLIKNSSVIQDGRDYDNALQITAEAGLRDAVEYLMKPNVAKKYGRDSEKKDHALAAVIGTIKKGQVAILQSFLRSNPGMVGNLPKDAMATAALRGHVDMLDLLGNLGVDIEAEGKFGSALRSASLQGDEFVVRKLLGMGANAKAIGARGDCLQAAASKGHVEIMKLLISKGAEVNRQGKPCGTCIQAAAYRGHKRAVIFLIEEGAEIYCKGKFEDALHAAVQGGHQEIASYLQETHPPPAGRALPHTARGDNRRSTWYSEGQTSDPMDERRWETSSPHPEDTDDEDDVESPDSVEPTSNNHDPTEYGLVFAATIENISTVRQELQASCVDEDEVTNALVAAAGKGKHRALKVLLEDGLRHITDPRRSSEDALIAAILNKQVESYQMLSKALDHTLSLPRWASALKGTAMTGDRSITTQILAIKTMELCPFHLGNMGENPPDPIPWFDLEGEKERADISLVSACKMAIETACLSDHHQVASLIWDWALTRGPHILGANIKEWGTLSSTAARFGDAWILETCLALEEQCHDFKGKSHVSKTDLLLEAVRCQNARTFKRLSEWIEQEKHDGREFVPSFMEACSLGFDERAFSLSSWQSKIVLRTTDIETALLIAAKAGKPRVIQHLLNETDIQDQDDFTTIITRTLVTACESGHENVVEICLDEGADPELVVLKISTDVLPRPRDEGLQRQFSTPGRQMPFTMRNQTPFRSGFRTSRFARDSPMPSESSTQRMNALQASLSPFARIRAGEGMPGFDTQSPSKRTDEERQLSIVRLILAHGADLGDNEYDHPLRMAAQWGTAQVVQVLLENGAADGFNPESLRSLCLLAAERRTATAFRIILQLLNRGASMPTARDGSLAPAMLEAIERATDLIKDPNRARGFQILSKRGMFTSDKAARDLMKNGLREFIQVIFRKLPSQTANTRVFGDVLHVAAVAGDFSTVRLLIKHNVDVNHIMFPDHSPLGAAAEFGQTQIMKALIKAGASIHSGHKDKVLPRMYGAQEPAIKAIIGRQASALKLLLDAKADPNLDAGDESLLILATQSKLPELLSPLLEAGVDVKGVPLALITAAHDGSLELVMSLLNAGADPDVLVIYGTRIYEQHICNALYISSEMGHTQIVQELLQRGADASLDVGDRDGLSLVVAARQGHLDIVKALLEYGCDPTRRSGGRLAISPAEQRKFTPLLDDRDYYLSAPPPESRGNTAIRRGNSQGEPPAILNAVESACISQKGVQTSLQILNLLFEAVNDPENRQTTCLKAIEQVSEANNSRILEALLDHVPLDSVALYHSCRCGSVRAVQKVLDQGTNINTAGPNGQLPLQVAINYGHSELILFLVANGANLETPQDEGPPLNIYCLSAAVIESYAFSTQTKHKSIATCELVVHQLLTLTDGSQTVTTEEQKFLDRSLILACHIGSTKIASTLLDLGARLDRRADLAQHRRGHYPSPLLAAIEGNHPSMLRCLFQWCSDPKHSVKIARSLEEALKACLGKTSPVLLQTFLACASTVDVTDQHLALAVQRDWERGPGESDLEILLQHCPSLGPSEDTIVALLGAGTSDYPAQHCLYRFVLERSDCGVTKRMLREVADPDVWRIFHDYYQVHQATRSVTNTGRHGRSSRDSLEDEFQTARERIEDPPRRLGNRMTVAELRRAGIGA
ncbi:hypothetical protein B0J13DRAFT_549955 [Dactylonectria estremocensis]|uniref:Nephrocystin 3-like N-terminal domain-containing protein n=1 Tax=Dactylonectria estremocensis TaxID=1079267 RepID=A0A9P9J6R0_9HYPO|nr:hypothetical protein B0J13DRAFT_549955 [Dactylonectria estremocensis]